MYFTYAIIGHTYIYSGKDTLGQGVLSFIERFPLFEG